MNSQEVRGRWDQIRGKVKEKWGQLTDDDLKMVGGNVDQIVGKIHQKTGEARRSVENFLDEIASEGSPLGRAREAVANYSQAAAESAREGIGQAADQVRRSYERAGEMVKRHPAESIVAVFGAGFVLGLTIGVLLSNND